MENESSRTVTTTARLLLLKQYPNIYFKVMERQVD